MEMKGQTNKNMNGGGGLKMYQAKSAETKSSKERRSINQRCSECPETYFGLELLKSVNIFEN